MHSPYIPANVSIVHITAHYFLKNPFCASRSSHSFLCFLFLYSPIKNSRLHLGPCAKSRSLLALSMSSVLYGMYIAKPGLLLLLLRTYSIVVGEAHRWRHLFNVAGSGGNGSSLIHSSNSLAGSLPRTAPGFSQPCHSVCSKLLSAGFVGDGGGVAAPDVASCR